MIADLPSFPQLFETALAFVIKAEGGYSNQGYDGGKMTYKGVTENAYIAYLKQMKKPVHPIAVEYPVNATPTGLSIFKYNKKGVYVNVHLLITEYEVKDLYYRDYWLSSHCDKLTNHKLAIVVFDTSVNHGISVAMRLLKQSNYSIPVFLSLRAAEYRKDASYPGQGIFLKGWLNRIEHLKAYIVNVK